MLPAVWKTISLFMSLGAFLAIAISELVSGEDLIWVVAKAMGSFVVCWFVMGFLGNVLLAVVEKQSAGTAAGRDERG